jgi:hypothetical protein
MISSTILWGWHRGCLPSHERSGATVRSLVGYVLLANACIEVARAVSPPAHAPPQADFVLLVAGLAGGAGSRGLTARQKQTRREQCSVTSGSQKCKAVPRRNAPV